MTQQNTLLLAILLPDELLKDEKRSERVFKYNRVFVGWSSFWLHTLSIHYCFKLASIGLGFAMFGGAYSLDKTCKLVCLSIFSIWPPHTIMQWYPHMKTVLISDICWLETMAADNGKHFFEHFSLINTTRKMFQRLQCVIQRSFGSSIWRVIRCHGARALV